MQGVIRFPHLDPVAVVDGHALAAIDGEQHRRFVGIFRGEFDSHVIADRMEPLDFLYEEEGWTDIFPQDLITIASYDGKPWSVPVNIHRSNVLWYRTDLLEKAGVSAAPTTWTRRSFDGFSGRYKSSFCRAFPDPP